MTWFGPFYMFAHESTDEDCGHYTEELEDIGVPPEDAKKFVTSNPLYEVEFEFYVNPETGHYRCTGASLGGGVDLVTPADPVEKPYR